MSTWINPNKSSGQQIELGLESGFALLLENGDSFGLESQPAIIYSNAVKNPVTFINYGGLGYLLDEDGFYILTEDGFKIILQESSGHGESYFTNLTKS